MLFLQYHVPMVRTHDGEEISDSTDFDALALRVLQGKASLGGPLPSDDWPGSHASTFWCKTLRDMPLGEAFARAIAGHVASDDPAVRFQALVFFDGCADAPGREAIVPVVERDPTRFLGYEHWGYSIERKLVDVINALVKKSDAGAIRYMRASVVRPQPPDALVGVACVWDREWTLENLESIAAATPTAAPRLLESLAFDESSALVVAPPLLRVAGVDRSALEAFVRKLVPDSVRAAAILAAPAPAAPAPPVATMPAPSPPRAAPARKRPPTRTMKA